VTGANRGIGFAFAEALSGRGDEVIATARTPEKAADLRKLSVRVEQLDVADEESLARLAKAVKGVPIDVLLNNAAIGEDGPSFPQLRMKDLEEAFRANATGPAAVAQALLPNLRAGNRSAAGQYALRLQTVQRELEENRKQLEQAEATYKDLLKARDVAVSSARAKIESLRSSISDLKMKKAMAELDEMASGMISSIGGSGDTLDRLQTMVEEERTKAAGRARVARDSMDMSGVQLKEAEQDALADQALADFAAKEGIALESSTSGSTTAADGPVKTMGPQTEKN